MYVRVLEVEFNQAMADGKRERVPKKEIKECFFFKLFFCILVEDGIRLEVC